MQLQGNTILITGGSSGIGLQLAKLLSKDNRVLICGRSQVKLDETKQILPSVEVFRCDLAVGAERKALFEWVRTQHPTCNVLINNAAIVHKTDFDTDPAIVEKAIHEIQVNLIAPVELAKLFLPLIQQNPGAAIINITSGLVFVPRAVYPVYSATKAALHSFTQVVRQQMQGKPVRWVEVQMPAVDTPWHKGTPPRIAIPVEKAVADMLKQLAKGKEEIRVGGVRMLYLLSRLAPAFAFRKLNSL